MYARVPTPCQLEPFEPFAVVQQVDAWLTSAPFLDLVERFGGRPEGSLPDRLEYLQEFTKVWDRRAGAGVALERNQVDLLGDPGLEEPVLAAATALGLVEPVLPPAGSYDHVLMLGGLVRANVLRSAYAAQLLERGAAISSQVTALTAFRALARTPEDPSRDEPTLLGAMRLPVRDTEAECVEDAMARAFGFGAFSPLDGNQSAEVRGSRFRVAEATAGTTRVTVVAAPDPRGAHRADTASTMRFWAENVAHLKPGARVLAVTTQIYVPYQHAAALQHLALPFGVEVFTAGVDVTRLPPTGAPAQEFHAVHYLQEVRSTVQGFARLVAALDPAH